MSVCVCVCVFLVFLRLANKCLQVKLHYVIVGGFTSVSLSLSLFSWIGGVSEAAAGGAAGGEGGVTGGVGGVLWGGVSLH